MNRREFLSATAATMAAGALLPRPLAAQSVQKSDGMNYAPQSKPSPVVKPGEFTMAAVRLDHGHIYGMCNGFLEAGATLCKWCLRLRIPKKVEAFQARSSRRRRPPARWTRSSPTRRSGWSAGDAVTLGERTDQAGPGDGGRQGLLLGQRPRSRRSQQLDQARAVVARDGQEAASSISASGCTTSRPCTATDLVQAEEPSAGSKSMSLCIAPHRLAKATRPEWFFQRRNTAAPLRHREAISSSSSSPTPVPPTPRSAMRGRQDFRKPR